MILSQKPAFKKAYKKLPKNIKEVVDDAIRAIQKNPYIGEPKKGDLAGCHVHKFTINKQQKLLAYAYNRTHLILLAIGTHENFYRDLKR